MNIAKRIGLAFFVLFPIAVSAQVFDRLSLEYSNTFLGPSLANPISSTHSDDEAEDHQGSLELENVILAGYRLSSDVTLGGVTKWKWHVAAPAGQVFELLDPYLRLSHGKLYSNGTFNAAVDLRLSAPISEQSRNNGLTTSLASEQVLSFGVPESRFTLGLTTFIQFNFHRDEEEGHQDGDLLELRFSPAVEYKISDSLLVNIIFEATKAQPRFTDLTARHQEGSLIEMGLAWDIMKNLRFNPNIHTRTSRPLSAESFTFGAKLNWVLL